MNELKHSEPLCFTFYPGERPHCYDLLGLEAYLDQYRATGAPKYLDAVLGGWAIYNVVLACQDAKGSIRRQWADNDVISFTLPVGFGVVKYTGLDQAAGNVDRYALLRGPVLMALNDADERIQTEAATLPSLLTAVEGDPLHYAVRGTAYRFLPYWQVAGSFTCFPMIQP